VAVIAAGIGVAWVHRGQIDPIAIRDAVAQNPASPLIFLALQILASLFFIPRTVLGIAAGLVFGLVWGTVWALTGAMAGAACGLIVSRWFGAGLIDLEATPRLGPLLARAESGGWRAVTIVRLVPIPHSVVNYALGLTKVGWRDYLVGSLIGMVPMTLVQVDIGAAGGSALTGGTGWMLVSLLGALALGLSFIAKRSANRSASNGA
jgi:uncharacterized membrane protein YdjX (TVP38/TMEM64 family)